MKHCELQRLIAAWIDGRIEESEAKVLEEALATTETARAEFRRWTQLDAALRERAATILESEAGSQKTRSHQQSWYRSLGLRASGFVALAASLVLMFVLWRGGSRDTVEATSNGCAVLSLALDATFESSGLRAGDTLVPGVIELKNGLAQIEFFSGATALVEGAAKVEIISAWEARCLAGRLRVHVPPAAKGFVMHAPGIKLEDLGTEFGLNVDPARQSSALHVFEGEVIAHRSQTEQSKLTQGMGLAYEVSGRIATTSNTEDFLSIGKLPDLIKGRQSQRFAQWQAWSTKNCSDPRLIAYYTFKHWPDNRWDRLVNNFAEPKRPERAGGAVGARWVEGRWPGKEALEFKGVGDRVRINIDGQFSAITLACWVKVDSIDKKYNSLLLTDGYESGEPHWQIYEDGRLLFSIAYNEQVQKNLLAKNNQLHYSKPVFSADSLGRWHHLAVTYENQTGSVVQYFDGQEVGRQVHSLHQPGRPIVFGACEIGNWGLPTGNQQFAIRNLNGAIDEFAIYSEALSSQEIQNMFHAGATE